MSGWKAIARRPVRRVCFPNSGRAPHSSRRTLMLAPCTSFNRPRTSRARLWLTGLEERAVPAVFTVANTADAGAGSLRQAILDANAAPGADTITFDPAAFATPRTITLTSGEL